MKIIAVIVQPQIAPDSGLSGAPLPTAPRSARRNTQADSTRWANRPGTDSPSVPTPAFRRRFSGVARPLGASAARHTPCQRPHSNIIGRMRRREREQSNGHPKDRLPGLPSQISYASDAHLTFRPLLQNRRLETGGFRNLRLDEQLSRFAHLSKEVDVQLRNRQLFLKPSLTSCDTPLTPTAQCRRRGRLWL
jgi:hypothetical protein